MNAPDLSIIIVTWNVRDYTLACLRAIEAQRDGLAIETIIVDNGSGDGTPDAVRAEFPGVQVIEPGENLGFPRANNLAARQARGRHILYLNPDTEVGAGALRACVEELDRDAQVGVVGCRLVYGDGQLQPECGRRIYRLRHLAGELFFLHMLFPRSRVFGHHLMGDWSHDDDRDVEAVSGAFMMARKDAVDDVGGLPEDVFMYHEDMAFCLRVARAGWRVRMLGRVTTVHHGGRSSRQRPDVRIALLEGEYKLRLIREHEGRAAASVARGLFALRSALRMTAGALSHVLPGGRALRVRHPRPLDVRLHWLLLRWAIAPATVAHLSIGTAHGAPPRSATATQVVTP